MVVKGRLQNEEGKNIPRPPCASTLKIRKTTVRRGPCAWMKPRLRTTRSTKRTCTAKTCPHFTLTTTGLDREQDTVQRSMTLNLMPILHVLHIEEIISMSRRTNNCGGHMFTVGPDVSYSHASNSNISHG